MEAWLIKRIDGKYYDVVYGSWSKHWAYWYIHKEDAMFDITNCKLNDCKLVKVRIEEVEE